MGVLSSKIPSRLIRIWTLSDLFGILEILDKFVVCCGFTDPHLLQIYEEWSKSSNCGIRENERLYSLNCDIFCQIPPRGRICSTCNQCKWYKYNIRKHAKYHHTPLTEDVAKSKKCLTNALRREKRHVARMCQEKRAAYDHDVEINPEDGDVLDKAVAELIKLNENDSLRQLVSSKKYDEACGYGGLDFAKEALRINIKHLAMGRKKLSYSKGYIGFALILRNAIGTSGYAKVRHLNMYPLPARITIDQYMPKPQIDAHPTEISAEAFDSMIDSVKEYLKSNNMPKDWIHVVLNLLIAFDGVSLTKDFVFVKSTNQLIGLRSAFINIKTEEILKQLDSEAILIAVRSLTFSDWRFPLGIIGISTSSAEGNVLHFENL